MTDVLSDHLRRKRPPSGQQQQNEQPGVKMATPIVRVMTVDALYNTARSRAPADRGRSHNLWSTMSHAIIAALARIVAALKRKGPIVADNCQIVGYARLTAPVANAAIITFDIPATNRHGRLAYTMPVRSCSRDRADGAT
jgi:hypothetical protein